MRPLRNNTIAKWNANMFVLLVGLAAIGCGACLALAWCTDQAAPSPQPIQTTPEATFSFPSLPSFTPPTTPTTTPPVTDPTAGAGTGARSTPRATVHRVVPKRTTAPEPTRTTAQATCYASCKAAKAAGAAPLHRGDPGYRSGLDRDGDGVACET